MIMPGECLGMQRECVANHMQMHFIPTFPLIFWTCSKYRGRVGDKPECATCLHVRDANEMGMQREHPAHDENETGIPSFAHPHLIPHIMWTLFNAEMNVWHPQLVWNMTYRQNDTYTRRRWSRLVLYSDWGSLTLAHIIHPKDRGWVWQSIVQNPSVAAGPLAPTVITFTALHKGTSEGVCLRSKCGRAEKTH